MRRKNESAVEILFDILTTVPAWVGPVLAAVSYPVVRYLIPYLLSSNSGDPRIASSFNQAIASFARAFAPIIALLILMLWAGAMFKRWTDKRRLDDTEGLDDIHSMSWREFEALVGEAYRRQGYGVEETGSASGDGGVDLVLHRGGKRTLVQCKHWRARQVGVKVVRELQGVLTDDGADHGIIVTYGTFTGEARSFADRNGVELIEGADLARMIAEAKGQRTVAPMPPVAPRPVTTAPSAPHCPKCGGSMSRKVSDKGRYAGQPFWGCDRFPACKGLIPIAKSA